MQHVYYRSSERKSDRSNKIFSIIKRKNKYWEYYYRSSKKKSRFGSAKLTTSILKEDKKT